MEELHSNAKAIIQASFVNEQRARVTEDEKLLEMLEGKSENINEKMEQAIDLLSQMMENSENKLLNKLS